MKEATIFFACFVILHRFGVAFWQIFGHDSVWPCSPGEYTPEQGTVDGSAADDVFTASKGSVNEEEELEALRALMGDSSKHLKVRDKDFDGKGNVTLLGKGALQVDHPETPTESSFEVPPAKILEQTRNLNGSAVKTRPLVMPGSQTSSASTGNPAALVSLSNGLAEIERDASELPSDRALLSALVAYPRKPPPGSRCPFPHV